MKVSPTEKQAVFLHFACEAILNKGTVENDISCFFSTGCWIPTSVVANGLMIKDIIQSACRKATATHMRVFMCIAAFASWGKPMKERIQVADTKCVVHGWWVVG